MSFPDQTLYARNDDEMEDYGDIGAYEDSMEDEYEEEEEEEMDEPSTATPSGAMISVPAMPSRSGAPSPRKPPPKKKTAKKKAGKKKAAKKRTGKKKGRRR